MSWTPGVSLWHWPVPMLVMLVVTVSAGCIDGQRQQADTTAADTTDDTLTGDTDMPVDTVEDTGTVTNDLVPVDTDEPEVDVVECTGNASCVPEAPNDCIDYQCINTHCVESPLHNTTCDDGNACTTDDSCDHGVCEGADELECDEIDAQCWNGAAKTCDPILGCGGSAAARGVACDDEDGPEPGVCEGGWRIPVDTCDGQGLCVDRSGLVPSGLHPLAGSWYAVIASAPTQANALTLRAVMTFDNQGGLGLSNVAVSSNTIPDFATGTRGTYCASLDGEIRIEVGGISLVAWANNANETMIFGDMAAAGDASTQRFHGMAVRGSGSPNLVTGTYRLVSTATYPATPAPVMTWQGQLGFTDGCITDGGEVSTGTGLGVTHSYESSGNACFGAHQGGHRIAATLLPDGVTNPDSGVAVQWTGAISARGDLLLLTRDDGGLRYGILVLVRDQAAERADLSGDFAFVSLTGGITDSSQTPATISPNLHVGSINYRVAAQADGTLIDGGVVGPGWWFTSIAGSRYAHRVVIGQPVVEHSGWVSRDDSFIMGWRVTPGSNPLVPQLLTLTPAEGSLFLAVKQLRFNGAAIGSGL